MRNLKKFLALVLAMMMAFSLMVTANASKDVNAQDIYPDADKITEQFVEAVDVLYGMGVMTGDYGSFKADQGIMRSEMAAVLYRLMTGDTSALKNQLYADIAAERFIDVPANSWFAPYVGWCYDAGIMVGSNGYFRPTANVTGYETLVMVLRAMGYGKNHEYTGTGWYVNASSDGTTKGLLKDVNNTHYANTLSANTRRDVVASIVFQAAQLPTVRYELGYYNPYVGVASGQGNNVLNPSLGEINFGLTCHTGIVVGNQASGEKGNYATKIGFSVEPTISKGINVGQQTGGTQDWTVTGTLTAAEIVDDCDAAAYYYATDKATAENITLAFDWKTDLSQFNHKVKVWYDNRGTSTERVGVSGGSYNTSSVAFGTNCKTYALYDQGVGSVITAANFAYEGNTGDLNKAAKINADAFYNYAFAPMAAANQATNDGDGTSTLPAVSAKSPVKANNGQLDGVAQADHPLYLVIDNTGDGVAEVVISLNVTISQVTQDNNTQAPLTTGILTSNQTTSTISPATTGAAYFDLFDQMDPAATGDNRGTGKYSNILNGKMVDSDDVALRDYVAAVTVTGTTGTNNGIDDATAAAGDTAAGNATDGNAGATDNFNSTYYYKVDKLTTKVTKTVWKYDAVTQEVFFSDGTSFKRSIFAPAVDGGFKAPQFVKAPTQYGTNYTFWLDGEGKYLFWEVPTATSNFVYGTYIDWETKTASSTFDYPMVYVDSQGKYQLTENITKVDGAPMDITEYNTIELPKRDSNNVGNNSGFVKGVYIGYAMSDGVLTAIDDNTVAGGDQNTGFWQANTNNFGTTSSTTVISSTGVAIGAVPVANADAAGTINPTGTYNNDHLFLTETTKFVVVTGAGTDNQKATVYNGLKEFLGEGNVSVKIDATTLRNTATLAGKYLDETNAVLTTTPYDMVYYSLASETYDQVYDPSARVVDTVFIPDVMIERTPSVSGDLYFVGDSRAAIINANDNATLFTMYKDGVEGAYWINGISDLTVDSTIAASDYDADVVTELGDNVFYQLVDTGRTAHDGGKIYSLLPMSAATANKSIIGYYYANDKDTTATAASVTANAALTTGYLATTRNSQVAFIGGRNANFLYNVAAASVKNLNKNYTINSLGDLNGQSSLTSNQGVNVSCVLGETAQSVGLIYVNFVR